MSYISIVIYVVKSYKAYLTFKMSMFLNYENHLFQYCVLKHLKYLLWWEFFVGK